MQISVSVKVCSFFHTFLTNIQLKLIYKCIYVGDSCLKAAITLLGEEMEELEVGEPLIIEYVSGLVSEN